MTNKQIDKGQLAPAGLSQSTRSFINESFAYRDRSMFNWHQQPTGRNEDWRTSPISSYDFGGMEEEKVNLTKGSNQLGSQWE